LASASLVDSNIARANSPVAQQITTSSCDPTIIASPDQVLTVTGVYVPATNSPESTAVKERYRAPSDWPWLCRYRGDNQAALAFPAPNIVFFGDSITENWAKADSSLFNNRSLNRGIGGQTSSQLLLRFYQDVVALHPKVVHIIVGTNDVAGNPGSLDAESYKNNVLAMVDLARVHRIRVILGSLPPAARFPWRSDMPWRAKIEPIREIRALNLWLRQLSSDRKITFVDYFSAMSAPDGSMLTALSVDGVHPNGDGYKLMRKLAEKAIANSSGRSGD
jgi:lysophospholipase L1-like esterase